MNNESNNRKSNTRRSSRFIDWDIDTKQQNNKQEAFNNVGDMLGIIMEEFRKRALKILPAKKW